MIRIGIIGLGFMGRMHYKVYSQLAEAQVVMVADADPKRRGRRSVGRMGRKPRRRRNQPTTDG